MNSSEYFSSLLKAHVHQILNLFSNSISIPESLNRCKNRLKLTLEAMHAEQNSAHLAQRNAKMGFIRLRFVIESIERVCADILKGKNSKKLKKYVKKMLQYAENTRIEIGDDQWRKSVPTQKRRKVSKFNNIIIKPRYLEPKPVVQKKPEVIDYMRVVYPKRASKKNYISVKSRYLTEYEKLKEIRSKMKDFPAQEEKEVRSQEEKEVRPQVSKSVPHIRKTVSFAIDKPKRVTFNLSESTFVYRKDEEIEVNNKYMNDALSKSMSDIDTSCNIVRRKQLKEHHILSNELKSNDLSQNIKKHVQVTKVTSEVPRSTYVFRDSISNEGIKSDVQEISNLESILKENRNKLNTSINDEEFNIALLKKVGKIFQAEDIDRKRSKSVFKSVNIPRSKSTQHQLGGKPALLIRV